MKNTIFIIFLFFIYSCGYTAVYKNIKDQNFQIRVTEMQGDREMNNLIKNEIKLYSNRDSLNIFDIAVNTSYSKRVLVKDDAAKITDYELSSSSTFIIYFDTKTKKVVFNENINISNQLDTFDQDMYEKDIKRNFASSIREKLISEIINIK